MRKINYPVIVTFRVSQKQLQVMKLAAKAFVGGDLSEYIRMKLFESGKFGRKRKGPVQEPSHNKPDCKP